MYKTVNNIIACTLLLLSAGCGTLNTGGVYHGDKALYASDTALKTAVEGIDAFLRWEMLNHNSLKSTDPKIVAFANKLRDEVPKEYAAIQGLRTAYLANPTPENATSVQNIVNLLNAALAQAAIYLAQPPSTAPPSIRKT